MKRFKNILLIGLVLTTFSCEDFLGGDFNADPNKPNTVPIDGILPQIQISMADTYGGSFSRWNCMFIQQVEGVNRQWSAFNQYQIQPVRFDDAWSDYYENVLVELQPIKETATELEYNHYLGVAQVIEAFTLITAVDVWGDIPYTEAVLGAENFNPVFDDDQSVYTAAFDLLTNSLTLFAGPSGAVVPGAEDLYYAGDIDQWVKATHALLARYYLHLGNYASALSEAQQSFESRADNFDYQYGAVPNGAQWYRFNDGREGDIEFHPTMKAMLEDLNDDDRLGLMDNTFNTTHPYLVDAYRQDLISYREMQFLIAEALLETGGSAADIRTAYLNGIAASFEEFGFAADGTEYTSYVAQASVDPGVGNIDLEDIITQKYIAQFVQPEAFNDWRRTGLPALTATTGSSGIPRRWQYGFNSVLFNSNAPSESEFSLFAPRVFWDN